MAQEKAAAGSSGASGMATPGVRDVSGITWTFHPISVFSAIAEGVAVESCWSTQNSRIPMGRCSVIARLRTHTMPMNGQA